METKRRRKELGTEWIGNCRPGEGGNRKENGRRH